MSSVRISRVLLTADGTVWWQVWSLARALAERGIEVVVAAMDGPVPASSRSAAQTIPNLTIHESAWRVEWMDEPWLDVLRGGEWLLGIARRLRPDVVHLAHASHAALPWGCPVVVGLHADVLSWWECKHGNPAPRRWDRYWYEVARGLRAADMVVTPSRTLLDGLERSYGPLGPSRVVPYGMEPVEPPESTAEPFVIGAAGFWDDAATLLVLERIAARLSVPVYAAGRKLSPSPNGLRVLGTNSGDELRRWFARAPIFAMPTRYEPFGWGALQAAASGCALVLGDVPSLREIWGDAACFVDPEDDDELVEVLDALSAVEGLRLEMAERAREHASAFTRERMLQGWLSAYQAALDGQGTVGREVRLARGDVLPLAAFGLESP